MEEFTSMLRAKVGSTTADSVADRLMKYYEEKVGVIEEYNRFARLNNGL